MPTQEQLDEMDKGRHWAYQDNPEQAFDRIKSVLVNKLGYMPKRAERLVDQSVPIIQECLEDDMPLGSIAEFIHRR